MVKITLQSKGEIQKDINELIDAVAKGDIKQSSILVDKLDKDVTKYFVSRNLDCVKIRQIINDMRHTVTHFINKNWRMDKFVEELGKLYNELENVEKSLDTKSKLSSIYSEIKEDLSIYCTTGSPECNMALSDDFISLQNLSKEMSKYNSEIYNKYLSMMKIAGQCQAMLPRLTPQQSDKEKWTVRVDAVNSVTTIFAQLFALIEDVIASLEKREK